MSSLNAVASNPNQSDIEVVIVDANHSAGWFDLHELWRYRDLIWIFALRDITVRYRQTLVGIAWTVLQPLALMLALGVFKRMVVTPSSTAPISEAVSTGDLRPIPEAVSMLCGLILYQLFASIIGASTLCLVDNRQMLTKVYFPRIVLPLAAALRPFLDFGIGLIVLIVAMVWFQVMPHFSVVLAPIFVLGTGVVGLAFGLWLCALNAHYRDFGHIVPFALQLGLLISPVANVASSIPGHWRWFYFLNPMAALIECFRWSLLGANTFPGPLEFSISLFSAAFLLVTGAWYFRRVDRFLADSI